MNRAHEKSPWRVFQGLVCRFNKVVDLGNRFPGADVYDVVGHLRLLVPLSMQD